MRKRVMCYGDSLTWGIVPPTRNRHTPEHRWPKVVEDRLDAVEMLEEALNGRTTAYDYPTRPFRNGLTHLPMFLEQHAPLDLVIIMLATNDLFALAEPKAEHVMFGLYQLARIVSGPQAEPGMPIPDLMFVVPPLPRVVTNSPYPFTEVTAVMEQEARRIPALIDIFCRQYGYGSYDASWIETDGSDGVHLSAGSSLALGEALTPVIRDRLSSRV